MLRQRKKGKACGEDYRKERKEYNKLCEEKKQEENDRFIKEAEEATKESKVWELVNGERRKRRRIDEKIEKGEWKARFMRLLGGVEEKTVAENTRERRMRMRNQR